MSERRVSGDDGAEAGGGTAPLLAVVIGTYNRLDQLRTCLDSIRDGTTAPHEVWVTDAGSDDGTVEFLRERAAIDPGLRVVFEGERVGQAKALNGVFDRITAPYVCWLSDDNIVVDGGLDIALSMLRERPTLGMAGLKVRDIRGPFAAAPYIGGLTATGVLNINQGMLPTPLLRSLGGFDEAFRDYGIDADLTTRVLLAGYEVAMTRGVAIHHQRNWPEKGTPEAERMAARDRHYKELYWREYGSLMGRDPAWLFRRAVWKVLRRLLPGRLNLDQTRPVLGFLVRDWHNMIAGRYISLRSELGHPAASFHLLQRCPPRSRTGGGSRIVGKE